MKILVTGATGFFGSHLTRTLVRNGYETVILKRSFSKMERLSDIAGKLAAYDIDKVSIEAPFRDFSRIDAVVHAAATYGRNNEPESEVLATNTLFSLQILETAVKYKTDRFVYANTSLNRLLSPYSLSKNQFAEWGKLYSQSERIRFIDTAVEHFYGPGDDDSKFTTRVIRSCLKNVPELKLTAGEQKRDFIYIDDAVSALAVLLEKAPGDGGSYQRYGVGSGRAVSIREFVETVHKLTDSQTRLDFGAIPCRKNEPAILQADTTALSSLGWSCNTSLLEGLKMTIEGEKQL